jgi:hypothetical protein
LSIIGKDCWGLREREMRKEGREEKEGEEERYLWVL